MSKKNKKSDSKNANDVQKNGTTQNKSSQQSNGTNRATESPSKKVSFNAKDNEGTTSYYMKPSGKLRSMPSENTLRRLDRQTLVLYKSPLKTIYYFLMEIYCLTVEMVYKLITSWRWVLLVCLIAGGVFFIKDKPGPHQIVFDYVYSQGMSCAWWIGLGILSSVGLGSGLHTFLLYLGPHIAQVTLAAYECQSLDFPEPPYPDEIMCPYNSPSNAGVSIWAIMSKVRLEAFLWGAGTALGELPPYFMARTARLSEEEPDDDEYKEFKKYLEEQQQDSGTQTKKHSWFDEIKINMEKFIAKVGFFGILLCASIPNPLFDLAGITCGHFLVPFWTFFGATLIGKALVKMHIQKLFVIFMFSEHHVENLLQYLKAIPNVGVKIEQALQDFLRSQKLKLRRKPGEHIAVKQSIVGKIFDYFVFVMVLYFIYSIVNSMAQNYDKRLWKEEKENKTIKKIR